MYLCTRISNLTPKSTFLQYDYHSECMYLSMSVPQLFLNTQIFTNYIYILSIVADLKTLRVRYILFAKHFLVQWHFGVTGMCCISITKC